VRRTLLALTALALVAFFSRARSAPPAAPHEIRYRLAWDAADEQAVEGSSFVTTNDRGYRIRIARGYLTSYSMELVECPQGEALSAASEFLWSAVEGTAYAGHGAGTPNPAAVRPMQIESLTAPGLHEAGKALPPPQSYCQVHYLIARAAAEARDLPGDLDMVDASLHIEGSYTTPGSSTEVPFTLHTAIANGALLDHATGQAPIRVDTGRAVTTVTVRRHLARAFDGIDFATVPPKTLANLVLQSLVDHVEVEVESVDANG